MSPRAVHIVCTIGPASRSPEVLRGLVEAGMNVARLNFAHGSEAEHRENVARIRSASTAAGRPVAILQDLPGPKIRLGELVPPQVVLENGARVVLVCGQHKGDAERLPVPDEYLALEARVGSPILLGDGAVELEITEVDGPEIHCRVVVGGAISSGKGVNAPGGVAARPILSERDARDLELGAELAVDLVGVSYVRSEEDVLVVRRALKRLGRPSGLVAKIETKLALDNLDAILSRADAVMLSEETAVGADPVRACRAMARIIAATEEAYPRRGETPLAGANEDLRELVVFSSAAVRTARDCGARAILTWARGGIAARLLSRQRPDVPIVAPSRYEDTWRRLALPYGVRPVLCPHGRMTREQLALELGAIDDTQLLLMVGHTAGEGRRVPWMKLVRVADTPEWAIDPRE